MAKDNPILRDMVIQGIAIDDVTIDEMVNRMEYIVELSEKGEYDGNCSFCVRSFLSELLKGRKIYDIFAPRHKARQSCKSGMNNHCTCDTCF